MYDGLVLDIGGDVGALIIHAGRELLECEIELSPIGLDDARFHNVVHDRWIAGQIHYCAVFPAVTAGNYTVWCDATTKHGTVLVHGGEVADYHWARLDHG
ncbi:hypothetical protein GCM10010174_25570 [Kutzneria viridogrisea]|uniref:Uncharacterized protein n=2 Tax=Kutzneria TaxID=43356 RepID=W5W3Y2_9PSEU|nr:hypothetical protein [Kutzneria albida]AHH95943.1 hypothetical protein KALB_2575 [Kutzneria albida DSM 43870]MBA8928856.1 hypothetical protein [Kutzneria viridogrisea]